MNASCLLENMKHLYKAKPDFLQNTLSDYLRIANRRRITMIISQLGFICEQNHQYYFSLYIFNKLVHNCNGKFIGFHLDLFILIPLLKKVKVHIESSYSPHWSLLPDHYLIHHSNLWYWDLWKLLVWLHWSFFNPGLPREWFVDLVCNA